jgi:F-type H+-transporting ATPase subunit beta
VIETGIKVLDFFTPFVKGRKIGVIGGAGVGKTVLTTEIMNNIGSNSKTATFFVGIGERMREGHELYYTLKDKNALNNTVIYLAQMNENAALRSLVGQTALRSARYLRDNSNQDVLVFIDNIYRHIQANNELSNMLGDLPSEGGYQPNMYSDIREIMEGFDVNENGSITTVQSIYVPADDLSDPAVLEISHQLDSVIVLSRSVLEKGIFPAVDLLETTSSLITEDIVGKRHYDLVMEVKKILQRYEVIRPIIDVIGENEISPDDRINYHKALKITSYFSQNMFVTEDLKGQKGQYFSIEDTLSGIEKIINSGYENQV